MKNKLIILVLLFFVFSLNVNALEINSKNAILYNVNTDEVIYKKIVKRL